MTPTPEQNAKRFIELSENVSVLSTTETNAVILARAYLDLETELQQLRLAADGMRDAAKELLTFHPEEAESGAELPRECWTPEYAAAVDGVTNALLAYRAAGEGSPKDTGTSRE